MEAAVIMAAEAAGMAAAAGMAVSMYTALEVSVYIADAHFSDAASAAVVVAAEDVGAAEVAGYGHPPGADQHLLVRIYTCG